MSATLIQVVDSLVSDIKPLVEKIEASIPITQDHYDQYGSLIATLSKGNKNMANVIAIALIKAGANTRGVISGLRNYVEA